MAEIKPLISTSELKTTLLASLIRQGQRPLFVHYDSEFDALMLLVVPPETETVVHYVDDHIALLYQPDTLEIVGMQVEDFEHSFLPAHENVQRVWRLSDTGNELENVGDMILAVERMKPEVAREVVKAAEDLLGKPGQELVKALA